MKHAIFAGSLLAGLLLAAGALPAAAQSPADWDKVIAAAKAEGKVVLYSGAPGAPEHREVARLFEARYGIPVDVLDGPGSQIQERIRTEVTANKPNGDVSHIGGTTQVLMQGYGHVVPHGGIPNLSKLTIAAMVPEEVPVFVNSYGLIVNTQLVPPGQEPKSWRDLLDPRWKDKILAYPMSASGSGATWFGVMQDHFGTEFHEKLAQQKPTFSVTIRENPRRVARGEFPLYLPFTITDAKFVEGLPVKAIVPQEGVPFTPFSVAMIKNAPHPNAARLLINFFLEREAQLVYARNGFGVTTPMDASAVPENLKWSVNAKLMGRQKLEGQEERMRLAAKIYEGK